MFMRTVSVHNRNHERCDLQEHTNLKLVSCLDKQTRHEIRLKHSCPIYDKYAELQLLQSYASMLSLFRYRNWPDKITPRTKNGQAPLPTTQYPVLFAIYLLLIYVRSWYTIRLCTASIVGWIDRSHWPCSFIHNTLPLQSIIGNINHW